MRTIPAFPYGAHVCEVKSIRNRTHRGCPLCRRRRCRPCCQSADPARPGPWRHHAGSARRCASCATTRTIGQMLSATFMDYAMLRADHVPSLLLDQRASSPNNPLGIRAAAGGTTPALGVLVNAVVDALAPYGVTHIEMPVTPERSGAPCAARPLDKPNDNILHCITSTASKLIDNEAGTLSRDVFSSKRYSAAKSNASSRRHGATSATRARCRTVATSLLALWRRARDRGPRQERRNQRPLE